MKATPAGTPIWLDRALFFALTEGVGIALLATAFWSVNKWIALGLALVIYAPIMFYVLLFVGIGLSGGI